MLAFLKRLFAAPEPKVDHVDANLGRMPFDAETGRWYAELPIDAARTLRIGVAGDAAPSAQLLAHARDVANDLPGFLATMHAFLEVSAKQFPFPDWAATVRALEVEELELMWPGRPDDGMVYFRGADDDDRVWRCDYVGRRPRSLGFDS